MGAARARSPGTAVEYWHRRRCTGGGWTEGSGRKGGGRPSSSRQRRSSPGKGGGCSSSRAAGGARAGRRHKGAAVAPPRPALGAELDPPLRRPAAPALLALPPVPSGRLRRALSLCPPASPPRPARSTRSRARRGPRPTDRPADRPTDPAPRRGAARHHGNACQGLDHRALCPFGAGVQGGPQPFML